MTILYIALGLLGLGVVVFVHELGHFLAAKAAGITVEAFSVGWGPKLLSYTKGDTEYRLSLFLFVGGYCKLKGEELFRHAVEHSEASVPFEKGSLFSVSPLKRIATYFAGPSSNFLFAILVLSIVWLVGFSIRTYDSRIILLSEYAEDGRTDYPANLAGLRSGDRIVAIDGRTIEHYRDLQEAVTPNPGREITLTIERDGMLQTQRITPELDRESGSARIGVAAWVDPVIESVEKDTAASAAGLLEGDVLTGAGSSPIRNTLDFYNVLADRPGELEISYLRDGITYGTTLFIPYDDDGMPLIGISFRSLSFRSPRVGILGALAKGAKDTVEILIMSIKSVGLLFQGIDFRNAVSGPIRITYLLGEVTSQSFRISIGVGFSNLARFLSLLSVALFFMNLLPIPALDGGHILLGLIEMVIGRQVRPRLFYRFQIVGFIILMGILLFTTFNDLFFLFQK